MLYLTLQNRQQTECDLKKQQVDGKKMMTEIDSLKQTIQQQTKVYIIIFLLLPVNHYDEMWCYRNQSTGQRRIFTVHYAAFKLNK